MCDTGSRAKGPEYDTVGVTFRVSAVRRPSQTRDEDNGSAVPRVVSDEEIVDALWRNRQALAKELAEEANNRRCFGEAHIATIAVDAVEPASSVFVRFLVTICREPESKPEGSLARASASVARHSANVIVWVVESYEAMFGPRVGEATAPPESVEGFSATKATAAVNVAVAAHLEKSLRAPLAVSASLHVPAAKVTAEDASGTPLGRLSPILATIGTGLGVLGFVTFVGGLIVWARLDAAGLPPAPTLGVIPNQDLLAIGAETLLPVTVKALVFGPVFLAVAYSYVRWAVKHHEFRHAFAAHHRAFRAGDAGVIAAAGMFAFVFVVSVARIPWLVGDLTFPQLLGAVGGVFGASVVAGLIGSLTARYAYLAATVFILIGISSAWYAYWRAGNEEMIRGAAIIRDNKQAISGIFVAEGANRVYLAFVETIPVDDQTKRKIDQSTSRLIGITKAQVTDIAIADRKTPQAALDQALVLAKQLCELQPAFRTPTGGGVEECFPPETQP